MRLVKMKNNHYRFEMGARTFESDHMRMRVYLEDNVGIEAAEIELAMLEMHSNKHDTAYFGVGGKFLYTATSATERRAVAELHAIRQVRAEFLQASQMGSAQALEEAGKRLMALYITLDVENVLEALGEMRLAVLKKQVA